MKLRTTILQSGKNTTGMEIPEQLVNELGGGRRPKVRVTVNGFSYRSSIAPMGGRFLLGVSAEVREQAGISGGDTVDAEISLDTEQRSVVVPPDLAGALADSPGAQAFFDGLSYSNQSRHVLAIEAAKAPETRARRIARSVAMFADGRF